MTEQQRALMAHNLYTTRYAGYTVPSWHQLRDCEQFPWLAAADEAWRLAEGFRLSNEWAAAKSA